MKKCRLYFISFQIEWHWWFILRGRARGKQLAGRLLSEGKPLNSPELLSLNTRLNRRANKVNLLTERYTAL